jgi:putative transcriptional regulator
MPDSLRGQFLIASTALRDGNFFRTVVLIVQHDNQGAMGLVINRPAGVTVARALKNHFELPETGEMVYFGGPVERNALFVLHNDPELEESSNPVVEGIFVGGSPEVFESVVSRASKGEGNLRFRVFFGCAGWGPEQLEGELARNDWLLLNAKEEFVFHHDPYAVWELLLRDYRQAHPLFKGATGDFRLN